jgi:hypothetical protein
MTIEEQIIALLITRLKTILIANGYLTSAGTRVFRNLQYTLEEQERPSLYLFPGDNTASYGGNTPPCLGEQNHFLQIKIEGFIDDDELGTAGRNLCADLSKLLWGDEYYTGLAEGYEGDVKINSTVSNSGEDGFISFVEAEFIIFYVTATGEM